MLRPPSDIRGCRRRSTQGVGALPSKAEATGHAEQVSRRAFIQHRGTSNNTRVADLDGRTAGGWIGRCPDPDVSLATREAVGLEPAVHSGCVRHCRHGASAGVVSVLGGLHCRSPGRLRGGSPFELIVAARGHQTPIRPPTDTHSSQMQSTVPARQPSKHISRAIVPSSREGSSQRRVAPLLHLSGGTTTCDVVNTVDPSRFQAQGARTPGQ